MIALSSNLGAQKSEIFFTVPTIVVPYEDTLGPDS